LWKFCFFSFLPYKGLLGAKKNYDNLLKRDDTLLLEGLGFSNAQLVDQARWAQGFYSGSDR
jgi:hypothetical protein